MMQNMTLLKMRMTIHQIEKMCDALSLNFKDIDVDERVFHEKIQQKKQT